MKYAAPIALALVLGGCAHKCDCHDTKMVEPVAMEEVEVVEDVIVEPEAVMVEEVVVEQVEPAPVEVTTTVRTETVGTRRVTRRIVDELPDTEPTIPAIAGSAANDPNLSREERVITENNYTVETIAGDIATTEAVDAAEDAVDAATDAVEDAVDAAMDEAQE